MLSKYVPNGVSTGVRVIQLGGGTRELYYYPKDVVLVTNVGEKVNKGKVHCSPCVLAFGIGAGNKQLLCSHCTGNVQLCASWLSLLTAAQLIKLLTLCCDDSCYVQA
jgi:hypothetical protein